MVRYNNEAVSERGAEQEKIMKIWNGFGRTPKRTSKNSKKVLDKPKTV